MKNLKKLLKITSQEKKSEYNKSFNEIINDFELKYCALKKNKILITDFINQNKQFKGLYVFFFEDNPIYVGIARNLRKRVMQHVNGTHLSTSTLAYKIAKKIYEEDNQKIRTKKEFFEKKINLIKNVKDELKKLTISTIEIEGDNELAIFEIYCSMKFKTPLNSFRTH